MVVFVCEVDFEPCCKFLQIRESLVVKDQPDVLDSNQLFYKLVFPGHIVQHYEFGELTTTAKIVVNDRRIFLHLLFKSFFSLLGFQRDELSVGNHIIHYSVHRLDVFLDHLVERVERSFSVSFLYFVLVGEGCHS